MKVSSVPLHSRLAALNPKNCCPSLDRFTALCIAGGLVASIVIFWNDLGKLRRTENVRKETQATWKLKPGDRDQSNGIITRTEHERVMVEVSPIENVKAVMTITNGSNETSVLLNDQKGDGVDITGLIPAGEQTQIRLAVSDPRLGGEPRETNLIVVRIHALFPLDLFACYCAGAFVMYLLLHSALNTPLERAVGFLAAIGCLSVLHAALPEDLRLFAKEIFLALAALLLWRWQRAELLTTCRSELLALGVLLVMAFLMRWEQLVELHAATLDNDPQTYLEIAGRSSYFIDTEFREPLFLTLVKVGGWFFGHSATGLRLTTIGLSLIVLVMTWLTGRELFNRPVGLLAAAFVAFNGNFIYINVRGYRLELFALLGLAFVLLCFGKKDWPQKKRSIWLAVVGSLMCLTRTNSFSTVVVMLLFVYWNNGWNKRLLAAAIAIPLIVQIPSFIYWQQKYGDPMVAVNKHLKYYRNIEFVDHELVPKGDDPYRGPETNSIKYFLTEWHTPGETITNIMSGLQSTYIGDYGWEFIFMGSTLMMGLAILGWLRWFLTKNRGLLLWMFLVSAPVAFFHSISLDFRLILHILPFLGMAFGDALVTVVRALMKDIE